LAPVSARHDRVRCMVYFCHIQEENPVSTNLIALA
jgi:hypothetical protein